MGWGENRIGAADREENPTVLAKLAGGFAVIGDVQFLPGYCVPPVAASQASGFAAIASVASRPGFMWCLVYPGNRPGIESGKAHRRDRAGQQ